MNLIYTIFFLYLIYLKVEAKDDDYYKLLGVRRDASSQEIRKAFKALAIKLHPDKNQENPEAEAKFIKMAEAYEILKNPDTRREYDVHGHADFRGKQQSYHSYAYYRDQFGIYDDDPLIVTLSRADYELNVLDQTQAWFVNFFSPNCHHCHELAPTWRQLAQELEGVVRLGAVNCEDYGDDYPLCYQLRIESYPTLLYYEKEAHLWEGEKYRGQKTLEKLKEFVMSKLKVEIKQISKQEWESIKSSEWLLFLCPEHSSSCPETETIKKLTAIFEGLLPVGLIRNPDLCAKISETYKDKPIVFWQIDSDKNSQVHSIEGSDTKEILDKILNILPNPPELDENKFHALRRKLRIGFVNPILLCFYLGPATDLNLQLKRLPTMVQNIDLGLVNCAKSSRLCNALHIVRYPTWGVIKVGGAFEVYEGRDVLHEVAAFARDSSKSTNLHALSPADFINLRNEGTPWFIDWYAPWCPPCKRVTPELRKASLSFEPEVVQFGTVDCTLHRNLCMEENIRSYPTLLLYNGSDVHKFIGTPDEKTIVEFISDNLNPVVINLDEDSFGKLAMKSEKELWMVDYYAPWCGPCQRMMPEWNNLAKSVADFDKVVIAKVDCVANEELCHSQNIRGYPTIRLYPFGSKGLKSVAVYNGNRDHTTMKRWLLNFLPSKVEAMDADKFKEKVLTNNYVLPWLVDFYAPWCGPCTHFMPDFMVVAQKMEGKIKAVKVDCEENRIFCGYQHVNSYPTVRLYISPDEYYTIKSRDPNEVAEEVLHRIDESKRKNGIHDEL